MTIEKRHYIRHDLEVALKVSGTNEKGKPFSEEIFLLNISGGGALFITSELTNYHLGQSLETKVDLPGTDKIKGHMYTKATVVRLDTANLTINNSPKETIQVAIYFQKFLQLKRNNHHKKSTDI